MIIFQVCGPTIPKNCKQFTAYSGMCFKLDSNNNPSGPIPSSLRGMSCASTNEISKPCLFYNVHFAYKFVFMYFYS